MKYHLIFLIASFCLTVLIHAQDPVDRLDKEYTKLEHDGLAHLHKRHYDKLIKVRDAALLQKNLPLANKAQKKLKFLKDQLQKLNPNIQFTNEPKPRYPSNQFYRMIYNNKKTTTAENHKIVCRFEKTLSASSKMGTLVLTLSSDNHGYANTPNEIFILNNDSGRVVGKLNGIGRNQTRKIPLTLSASKKDRVGYCCSWGGIGCF